MGFPSRWRRGSHELWRCPRGWSGWLWGRTLCAADAAMPATLAKFTLDGSGGLDFFDVSLVDGYNLPMAGAARCVAELNAACPAYLRVGGGVACRSA
ncbi:pathogenesis-related protein 5-like [Panicum virgatum]|uniref:pathogenesis-related protein 5-like n=1 Tax=Panicum virgatum TaxID=38727 RepID=UPI0019D624FD|nr:pathogenesis-related protein 5-like [Panicum virgatum]